MFYLFNDIKRKDILDSFLALENEISGEDEFLSKIISFSVENGINGNLWKKYILYILIFNENPYTLAIERNKPVIGNISYVEQDLKKYYELYSYESNVIDKISSFDFKKEDTSISKIINDLYAKIDNSFSSFYDSVINFYKNKGIGEMALYKAFRVENGVLYPIYNVLNVTFDDLIGYDYQKKLLIENTKNFISGRPYNNVLLYGDSGTGKSTSIKAVLNEFFDDGLRIIEVYKHQMEEISNIIHTLRSRPYFYMIYMDDLSFEENEIEYKYLKSIIEGGIEPKPDNVVIYATSNRKHLIKETSADNKLDDLHRNESQAEKLSLAYRFGLQIYYGSLSFKEFKNMVVELAQNNNIKIDETTLLKEAASWELTYGSLSGRCAQQFIRYLVNKIK